MLKTTCRVGRDGNSTIMGHGPGITMILSCKAEKIKERISKDANIANFLT